MKKKNVLIAISVVVIITVVTIPLWIIKISKAFTSQEQVIRTDWTFDTGSFIEENAKWEIDITRANLGEGIYAFQLVPKDIKSEGFTYYDQEVQNRLYNTIEELKVSPDISWTATQPLAILNPYGTGSNGLYLYFKTDLETKVNYTIHVEGGEILDFSAEASDISGKEYTRTHEFQMIGLVPGEKNEVTISITGSWGKERQTIHFTVDVPETSSGYSTQLEVSEGTSTQSQSNGLFAMMRVNGYLGYGFFFDNNGILRYEMVLEGYGLDRILYCENEIITCVSSSKLAKINGLGRVTRIYELDGYDLHHDISLGGEGEVLALAEIIGNETVEDRVLSIDLESGRVTELLNFSELMNSYYETTRAVSPSDDFFWQAGEKDWIHLNSLVYGSGDDSLILSSRETSTIIKVTDIHETSEISWLIGDERIWEGTEYEDRCLTQNGDFVPQYGQHCVEYVADREVEGVYYISLYNNNYWSINSRDLDLTVDDSVGTDLYDTEDKVSNVYISH